MTVRSKKDAAESRVGMRRLAFFFDIDGTLWDNESRMPDSAMSAIRDMRKAGHKVLICSGRSRGYVFDPRLAEIGFDGYVTSAGAMVEIEGETLYCRLAPAEHLADAVNAARAHEYGPLLEGNEYLYMDREEFIPTAYIDKLYRELGPRIQSLNATFGQWPDVTKLSMIARGKPCPEEIVKEVEKDWDVILHIPEVLELVPKGIDKGTGLRMALDALGIAREDSVAFGDGANDLAMFRDSGLKIAMGNGSSALKARADYVTSPLWEDGILNAWEWLKGQM